MAPLRKAPDGGWGWVCVFGSAYGHFILVGVSRSFGVFYIVLLDLFGSTAAATSWVVSVYNACRYSVGPVASYLSERFSCRSVVMVGGIITCLGCIISSFAANLIHMYLAFGIVTGVGACLAFCPGYIVITQYFDQNKGKAMGLAAIGGGLGSVVLPIFTTFLLGYYGYRGAMWIVGGLTLNVVVVGAVYRPIPPIKVSEQEMREITNTENENVLDVEVGDNADRVSESQNGCAVSATNPTEDIGKEPADKKPQKTTILETVKKYIKLLGNVTALIYCSQVVALAICIPAYHTFVLGLAKENNIPLNKSAFFISLTGIADIIGNFTFGFLFDLKFIRSNRRVPHSCITFLCGTAVIIMSQMKNYTAMAIVAVLYGVMQGGMFSQRVTVLSEFVTKPDMPTAVGLLLFAQGIGNLIGLPLAGLLKDYTGTYSTSLYFVGSCLSLSAVAFILEYFIRLLLIKKKRKNLRKQQALQIELNQD